MRPARWRIVAAGSVIALVISALAADMVSGTNRLPGGQHWGDGSLSREYVTIVDYTPSGWPVFAAAINWDAAPRIDIVYRYGSCGSPGHCIGVRLTSTWPYTCAQSGGYAVVRPQSASNNHIDPDTSYIRFNDRCGGSSWTNRDRQALACEEEGHIIGLDHASPDLNGSTCMASGRIDQLHHTPRQHDFDMLSSIYAHSH
jgi:hypothetical protein